MLSFSGVTFILKRKIGSHHEPLRKSFSPQDLMEAGSFTRAGLGPNTLSLWLSDASSSVSVFPVNAGP